MPIVSDSVCEAASNDAVTITDPGTGQCVTQAFSYSGQISSDMVCASQKIIYYRQQTRFAPGLQARTLARVTVGDLSQ